MSMVPLKSPFWVVSVGLPSFDAGSKQLEFGEYVVLAAHSLLLEAIWSPMPSLRIASAGAWPAVAKSGSSYPMDFAASRAFFIAAAVEISGLGAPFGTAT